MKFEPWRLNPTIIDVSDDEDKRLGLIYNPQSERASFLPMRLGELKRDEMREILERMEPIVDLRDELLTALIECDDYQTLYARCMALVDQGEASAGPHVELSPENSREKE